MSLNTLATAVSGIVKALHVNNIVSALVGAFVGRNSSGAPASGQDLGTLLYPWGTAFVTEITYQGTPIQGDLLLGERNRVISGQVRSTSGQPDYLRASGSGLTATLLATSTNLRLVINDEIVEVTTDIPLTSLTAAPSSLNTCAIQNTDFADENFTFYAGEIGTELPIDTAAGEITDRLGFVLAFKTVNGEILVGKFEDLGVFVDHRIVNAFRGFFFDSSGDPIERASLADNDVLTLMSLGWVFIQNNWVTVDVSYVTPITSETEPVLGLDGNALTDGQYWFSLSEQTWKRYSTSSASFEILNRMLVGYLVMDDTDCIASRSIDFGNVFDSYNSLIIEEDYKVGAVGGSVPQSQSPDFDVSIYGTTVNNRNGRLVYSLTDDLESGVVLTNGTKYYCYLSNEGEKKISDIKPYVRTDLRGLYHPYNIWRAVAEFYYDSGVRDYIRNYGSEFGQNFIVLDSGKTKDAIFEYKEKILEFDIGSWNMNTTASVSFVIDQIQYDGSTITLQMPRFRSSSAMIFNDLRSEFKELTGSDSSGVVNGTIEFTTGALGSHIIELIVTLTRRASGDFEAASHADTTINRGVVRIVLGA